MALLDRLALRDWRHLSGMFFVSTLLESLALGHMTAFTPLFLRDDLKMAPEDVGVWTGLLAAATFAVAFPLAPLWGSLAERYSRKLIIVRSQYIEAVGYTLCGLAPDLSWFILARLLLGLTFGNIAIVIATQSLITPDRRVASAISIVQAATPIAISFGPPLGALLLPAIGLRGLFIADGIGCLVAGLLVTLLMPEPPGRDTKSRVLTNMKRSLSVVWRRPAVRMNFGAWYFGAGGLRVADSYLPVRIAELAPLDPAGAIGVILGAYGVVTTLATWATGRIVDRFGTTLLAVHGARDDLDPGNCGCAVAVAGRGIHDSPRVPTRTHAHRPLRTPHPGPGEITACAGHEPHTATAQLLVLQPSVARSRGGKLRNGRRYRRWRTRLRGRGVDRSFPAFADRVRATQRRRGGD